MGVFRAFLALRGERVAGSAVGWYSAALTFHSIALTAEALGVVLLLPAAHPPLLQEQSFQVKLEPFQHILGRLLAMEAHRIIRDDLGAKVVVGIE